METLLDNMQFPPTETTESRALTHPSDKFTSTTLLSAAIIIIWVVRAQDDLLIFN